MIRSGSSRCLGRQAKHYATAVWVIATVISTLFCAAIQAPILTLNYAGCRECPVRLAVKAIQWCDGARRSHFVNRATASRPTNVSRSVEVPVGGLNESRIRDTAVGAAAGTKAVHRCELASQTDSVDRTKAVGAATVRGAIKASVSCLNQETLRDTPIRASSLPTEAVNGREFAVRSDPKERAATVRTHRAAVSAQRRSAIEAPIAGQGQPYVGLSAVYAVRFRAEVVQRRQHAAGGELEYGPLVLGSADDSCAVEVSIAGLHQRRLWQGTIGATCFGTKAVQRRQLAARCDLEYSSSANASTVVGFTVEVTVRGLRKPLGIRAVSAVGLGAEVVKNRVDALRGNSKKRSEIAVASIHGCAIKVAIFAFDK